VGFAAIRVAGGEIKRKRAQGDEPAGGGGEETARFEAGRRPRRVLPEWLLQFVGHGLLAVTAPDSRAGAF
jgi:hypothetical protein